MGKNRNWDNDGLDPSEEYFRKKKISQETNSYLLFCQFDFILNLYLILIIFVKSQ